MKDISARVEQLRKLIQEKETTENIPPMAELETPSMQELSEITGTDKPEDEQEEQPDFDPYRRPASLEGMTLDEILILQCDGGLDSEAQEWLSYKNIPSKNGQITLPNLKYILTRGGTKKLKIPY